MPPNLLAPVDVARLLASHVLLRFRGSGFTLPGAVALGATSGRLAAGIDAAPSPTTTNGANWRDARSAHRSPSAGASIAATPSARPIAGLSFERSESPTGEGNGRLGVDVPVGHEQSSRARIEEGPRQA